MVSSITTNLLGDRRLILNKLNEFKLFNCLGSTPFNSKASPSSSFNATIEMAKECNLYILILSNLYGYKLDNGKSATEIEFDSAYSNDPTKILVFYKKNGELIDKDQGKFIDKVTNYYSGYWRTTYTKKKELKKYLVSSITSWLTERASLNNTLNYFDHFLRIAKNIKPEPTANINYSVNDSFIEIEYISFGKHQLAQFDKKMIYNDFWNSIRSLRDQFEKWNQE